MNVLVDDHPVGGDLRCRLRLQGLSDLWRALDGKLGAHLRAQIGQGGFVVLDKIWDNGFRMITNSVKPINHPDDLRGMKIRTPVSALWLSLFKSLAPRRRDELRRGLFALQTKVDGQENLPAIISAAKPTRCRNTASVTNHMWDGWWFLINRRAWSQVPTGMQETVRGSSTRTA